MEARIPGRIITFYSYKGGTGRSLPLATTAWILAANGKRVLMLDWDLEAPGLHRYFKPFLIDKGLTSSEGIIDFVCDFADAVVGPLGKGEKLPEDWYVEHADLGPYLLSIDYRDFPAGGKIDFVPAGRQGPTYAARVNSFDWQDFYDRLGGGAFLEAAKAKMRQAYDYILVDSRTGVSDTSGICTAQLPDVLAVCFTYNNQSIEGAAAVARSAEQERKKLKGRRAAAASASEDGAAAQAELQEDLVIFPVPTRVDQSEQEKLRLRQSYAHEVFDGFLHHLDGPSSGYWVDIEVPYLPFMAYEEVLPVFTDDPRDRKKPLAAMIRLTGYLTGIPILDRGLEIEPEKKQEILREFAATPSTVREEPRSSAPVATPADEAKQLGTEATLSETQDFVRWRREIQPLLRAWSDKPDDPRTLLRGQRLAASKRWLHAVGASLTESEKTYVLESLTDQKQRQLVRWRALAAGLVIVAISLLAFLGWEAKSQISALNRNVEKIKRLSLTSVRRDIEKGKRAAESRDYNTALEDFSWAIVEDRTANGGEETSAVAEAYVGLALVRLKRGDSAAARQDLDHAIKLKPIDPAAYVVRGNLERDQGATYQALAFYDLALQRAPGYAEAYLNRGLAQANAQPPDFDGALADFQQAVAKKPELAEAQYYLGMAYQKRGEKDPAVAALQKATELTKDPAISVPAEASLKQLRGTTVPPTPTPAAPRVFLQYRDPSNAPILDAVIASLSGARFDVRGKELRGEETQGDIRYYYQSDKQNAESAKSTVEKALEATGHPLRLQTLYLGGTYTSVAPGTIEVWLPSLSPKLGRIPTDFLPAVCAENIAGYAECHDQYPTGCSKAAKYDAYLNRLKNLVPSPATQPVRWLSQLKDFADLDQKVPRDLASNNHAKFGADLKSLGEGSVVGAIGYLYYAQKGGTSESSNCQLSGPNDIDFHIGIGFDAGLAGKLAGKGSLTTEEKSALKKQSVIVEMTPHWRARFKPEWSLDLLKSAVGHQVRVVGQLLVDEHYNTKDDCAMPGADIETCWRASAWEIHPVTQLQVCESGNDCTQADTGWVELEEYKGPASRAASLTTPGRGAQTDLSKAGSPLQ